jgi:hypothetical protein
VVEATLESARKAESLADAIEGKHKKLRDLRHKGKV